MTTAKKFILELSGALLFFVCVLLLIRYFNLDLNLSDKANAITGFQTTELLGAAAWIGKYLSVIFCSLLLLSLPWLKKNNSPLIREASLAVLLLLIGPGLLNNFIFKPLFKRPRPVQIERYNKESQVNFKPALSIGTVKSHTSFPSGHSGAAFFFIFPWFCLRFRKKYGIRLIIPGLIFGIMTGSVRVLEGRHFLSDVIASLTVVYITGIILSYFIYKNLEEETEQVKSVEKI